MTRAPFAFSAALLGALLPGFAGCKSAPPEPSLLDREFEAYRLDRDERRGEDLQARGAKAKVEADRLEAELAGLMRRIREAKAKLPDAREEAARLSATPTAAPVADFGASPPPSLKIEPLPMPEHRTAPLPAK